MFYDRSSNFVWGKAHSDFFFLPFIFLSFSTHRYPLSPWCGNDRKLYAWVQWTGSLGCLLDARASLPCTQDQESTETFHLCALPGERELGTPGKWQCQAGRRGAPLPPSALPQCLFQQWSWCQSGLPDRGDALEHHLRVSPHLSFCPHPETRNLPVRSHRHTIGAQLWKIYTHFSERNNRLSTL